MKHPQHDPGSFPLPVRTRRTYAGNGAVTIATSVFCPRRDRTMEVADCALCDHHEGLAAGPDGREPVLLCAHATAAGEVARRNFGIAGEPSPADRTRIGDVMTTDVICVREDVSVEAVSAMLLDRGFSGVPVVDVGGFPIGVVSKTDLLRERHGAAGEAVLDDGGWDEGDCGLGEEGFHLEPVARATVGEVMMPLAFTLPEHASVSQAAALMAFEGVHRVPVVSEDGAVVGILSSLDILRWLARWDGYLVP
ncbi:MAG TPA: CBS domain-containing protein [Kofleriaceae bacterium]|nr:CBS domain-containing protein [Kofleriaceae bacterium]